MGTVTSRAGRPIKDMIGFRIGRLTVVGMGEQRKGRNVWICRCDCGNEKSVVGAELRRRSQNKSCGCLHAEMSSAGLAARATTHGMYGRPEHTSWISMIQRCTNENSQHYPAYGGRGIKVCDRWRGSFEAFFADMGQRPSGTSLDRFPDGNGNYEPGNCRWATARQQVINRRVTIYVTVDGQSIPLKDACDQLGVGHMKALSRLRRGWTPDEALNLHERRRA